MLRSASKTVSIISDSNSLRQILQPMVTIFSREYGRFISEELLNYLIKELPAYIKECQRCGDDIKLSRTTLDVSGKIDVIDSFWRDQMTNPNLKVWYIFATRCMLAMPSSAASERVFSLLKRFLTSLQYVSLNDRVEAACMLEYNKREVSELF